MPYAKGVYLDAMFTFIESSAFERVCPVYLDDDEYAEFQQFLMQNPEAGRVVPGSGGVRKLRWARPGMGKCGGYESSISYGTNRTSFGCWRSMLRPSETTFLPIF